LSPYLRRLRSGKWQATVRLPNGDRRSKSNQLKRVVVEWAADLEGDVRHGQAIDPRAGQATVGEMWELTRRSRRLSKAARKRDDSHWRTHVRPRWNTETVGPITRPDVKAWVVEMEKAGVGAATIQGCLGVLRAALATAVEAKKIRDNPAVGVSGPPRDAHLDRVLSHDEDEALFAAVDRVTHGPCPVCQQILLPLDGVTPEHRRRRKVCPGSGERIGPRPHGRLFAELLRYCGARWEEAAAVDREHVRTRDALLDLGPVVERDGTIRGYPKSPAGARLVPVPDHLWPRLRELALATAPGGLLFPSPRGGVLGYSYWYHYVWAPAIRGLTERPAARGRAYRPEVAGAGLADPQPTPHDLRHTYGTRLAEEGVPPHEIMALMGHERLESVQRYIHAGEARFERARKAVERSRGHSGRASNERHERQTHSQVQPHRATHPPSSEA
jgi:integrase